MALRTFYVCISRFYRHPKPVIFFLVVPIVLFSAFKLFSQNENSSKSVNTVHSEAKDFFGRNIEGALKISGALPATLGIKKPTQDAMCILPDLDVYHKGAMEFVTDFGELECKGERYGHLNNGHLQISGKGFGNILYQVVSTPDSSTREENKRYQLGEEKYLYKMPILDKTLVKGVTSSIQHIKGRCIHPFGGLELPENETEMVLWQGCDLDRIKFEFTEEGFLRHVPSKKCIRTKSGIRSASKNTPLVLSTECDEAAKFTRTKYNTIKHVASGMCIHDINGDADPPNDARLVLRLWCDKEFLRYFWFDVPAKNGNSQSDQDSYKQDIKDDFIKLQINLPGQPACCRDISEHHLQVYPKTDVVNRKQINGRNFDVLMIMLRSTSYAHFQRKMPKTFTFLNDEMKAVMFKGFADVEESAVAQLSAMLAGVTPSELADKSVDEIQWVFKTFQDSGYATMLSEDKVVSAMFKDALSGFKDQPVDHYAEPFWSSAFSSSGDPGIINLCLGSQAVHNISFSYMESFFNAYGSEKNKFGMVFKSEMSYGNPFNSMGYMDKDLMGTLKRMKENGYLDKTFLLVFSNHGMSTGKMRDTLQGKLEERSPLLMISLPTKLANIEEIHQNLIHNEDMIISPYDVYATLNHIGSYPEMSKITRGHSILNKLDPKLQKCHLMGIPKVWCPCTEAMSLSTVGPYVQKLTEYVLKRMNQRLSNNTFASQKCGTLRLAKVKSLDKLSPNDLVLSFKYSRSTDKCLFCQPVVSKSMSEKLTNDLLYRIQIGVLPSDNVYESQVNVLNGQILSSSNPKLISGEAGKCLSSDVKDASLKEICICN